MHGAKIHGSIPLSGRSILTAFIRSFASESPIFSGYNRKLSLSHTTSEASAYLSF